MLKYNSNNFTYGYELEIGDVYRSTPIPAHLGTWGEASEDIINLLPPYELRPMDPLGIDPPVGGEINTTPTKTWHEQVEKISEILEYFRMLGQTPTVSCISGGQTHVGVPNLITDIPSIKKLARYIRRNQLLVKTIMMPLPNDFNCPYMDESEGCLIPDEIFNIIEHHLTRLSDLDKMRQRALTHELPLRYMINIHSLYCNRTIEFRCFKATLNLQEISDAFRFSEQFINAALNDGPDVSELLEQHSYKFAPHNFDKELFKIWYTTKYPIRRMQKIRKFYDI